MTKPEVDMEVDDDDPITASYKVYLNPALPSGRRLLVLQHPNRTDDAPRPPPTELRLKSASGMVEVDMPIDHSTAYDRDKGLHWGRSLKSSMAAKNGGSHGLAGGFGVGGVQQRGGASGGRASKKAAEIEDDDMIDWNEAVRQDKVLRTQTLGGQKPDATEVQYMVGVFQGKDLHLTPVSTLIHLRPQLHHVDAATEQERQSSARDNSTTASGSGAGAAARAIHMTIKTTAEGDMVTTETMADRLRKVQSERWRRLRYTDENDEAAWDVYTESLFLRPSDQEVKAASAHDGKKPLVGGGGDGDLAIGQLEGKVPTFEKKWNDQQLLEGVSGIKKTDPELVDAAAASAAGKAGKKSSGPAGQEGSERKPKGRPRGGGAPTAARRGGRARTTAANPVEVE